MTAPKVSRDEAERFLKHVTADAESPEQALAYLRAVVSAIEEPSAVRLTKQEERLGYMMPKFKPDAIEELLRAADALLEQHQHDGFVRWAWRDRLNAAIAAVRRERGEEGR